jgi:hypothetical protein
MFSGRFTSNTAQEKIRQKPENTSPINDNGYPYSKQKSIDLHGILQRVEKILKTKTRKKLGLELARDFLFCILKDHKKLKFSSLEKAGPFVVL